MRYDARRDCYAGSWLDVPIGVFEETLARRVRGGESPDAALEDLLDEDTWSLDVPGVRPRRPQQVNEWRGDRLLWPLRFRAAVLHEDADRADELQYELEAAGLRAPAFVVADGTTPAALDAFLAPTPSACVVGDTDRLAVLLPVLQAALPECVFLSTGQRSAATVAQSVCMLLVARRNALPRVAAREHLLLQARLVRTNAAEQRLRALAYRGWARSLGKRERRLVAQSAMLREEAQAVLSWMACARPR
jgi:hypothetical protein